MTGDKWKVLDLNDECVVNECEGIVENLGAAWIRARLDFYGRWLDQLFGPSGQLLHETPTRKALMAAETLMSMLLHELDEIDADLKRGLRTNHGGLLAGQQPGLLDHGLLFPLAILEGPHADRATRRNGQGRTAE